jgi:hypothetical protein
LVARPVVGLVTTLFNEVIAELFDTMFPSAVETLVVNAPSALEVATTPVVGLLTVAVTDWIACDAAEVLVALIVLI